MKKLFGFIAIVLMLGAIPQISHAQNYSGYLGALDTLTNTDTTTYTVSITGKKAVVTWVFNQTKISGTVAPTYKIYGSADGGTTYTTYAVDSVTGTTNGNVVYSLRWTSNPFDKYKVIILSSGTQSFSQRTRLLYRE